MLTKLRLIRFKRFDDVEIELGDAVVFIGPNNSGKTTALQALTLWEIGLRRWLTKRKPGSQADERQGVAVNRRDLLAVPVPSGRLLWQDLAVRQVTRRPTGGQDTRNIFIGITVEGISEGVAWECGLEFDYTNEESFYVRPLRIADGKNPDRMAVPEEARNVRVAYLPPMSGLASEEFMKQPGELSVLIGQGQTAQVLRNLCYGVCYPNGLDSKVSHNWEKVIECIDRLFGAKLLPPQYIQDRGEIRMHFRERDTQGPLLDLSASGRGLQQTLLLLSYIYSNPGSVLLLDEPDAHLEVLRQRQTYQLIHEIAREQGAQIIAASHSEIVLNEAANNGTVIAFVGKPHTISNRSAQVQKALNTLGWDQYYEAELTGWVLYVEDATDLAMLKAFAEKLSHPARNILDRCFVHYVATNIPQLARDHFYGLREAKPDLIGIAIFDRLSKQLHEVPELVETMWTKREIENYFTSREVLMRWAHPSSATDLFSAADRINATKSMESAIGKVTTALSIDLKDPWSQDIKASDEVLDRVFRVFFKDRNQPIYFRKADYWQLIKYLDKSEIDVEISEKLDLIVEVARRAVARA